VTDSATSRITALARHEYRSATRSRVLLLLIASMVLITAVAIIIASYDFQSQVADYNAYVAQATAAGVTTIPPPQLFPLQLLRGVIEYIQIIGAVIAIGLGYLTVARERTGRTLALIVTRPVRRVDLFLGRLLGAGALIATVLLVTALNSVVLVGIVGGQWLSGSELLRVAITFGISILYMLMFYALGFWLTARSKALANGLVVAMVIWLAVVLVIPQIGDTMDPDNQVPGGLFAALQVKKVDEKTILAKFSAYENVRGQLEETSLTKHYERATFAYTGIKDKYNGRSLAAITDAKRGDIQWLVVYTAALGLLMWAGLGREQRTARGV
jgi:ABC-type transport system involved in multi-copper enzyme maturation permease subunit